MAFVQAVTGAANSAATTTGSAAFTSGRTLIIIACGANGGDAVNSIMQSAGSNNYFARPQSINNVSPGIEVWLAENITGFTGTVTVNWSASGDHAVIVAEYDESSAVGGVSNMTTGVSADASATLTPSDAVGSRFLGAVVYNNTSAYTAGTGNLQAQVNGAAIGVALVDNTAGSIGVTHATGTWRIGIVELIPDAIQGGNVWTSGGAESAAQYWAGFRAGLSFTTGANAAGYRLCVVKELMGTVTGVNVRAALYNNIGSRARLAFSAANVACGINAGANTRNMVAAPLSLTLAASTTYWPTMNSDGSPTTWQDGATAIDFTTETFGTPTDPWGTTAQDATGGFFWATFQAISSGTPAGQGTVPRMMHPGRGVLRPARFFQPPRGTALSPTPPAGQGIRSVSFHPGHYPDAVLRRPGGFTSTGGPAAALAANDPALVITTAGVLTTGIPLLANDPALVITTAAVLTTGIPLAASDGALVITTAGVLTTAIRLLANDPALVIQAVAALTTAIQMAANDPALVIQASADLTAPGSGAAAPDNEYFTTFHRRDRR